MIKVEYYVETGVKEEYYTLWKETTVDLRPLDKDGNPTNEGRTICYNRFGNVMDYFIYYRFVQNLSKTREGAIKKVKDMGIDLDDDAFDFELRHKGKPSVEAYGTRLQYKNGKWYGKATQEFFADWKNHKDEMKKMGWSCWTYNNPMTRRVNWYMAITPNEAIL